MGYRRVAVVMAGGSGTRFWPVSTATKPKQFLRLASADKTLLQQAAERASAVAGDDFFIATTAPLLEATIEALPGANVIAEPAKRNTLGALVWASAHLVAKFGESFSVAVLTADHAISPEAAFCETVDSALTLAEESGALFTIGIVPTRAATEYGYIETGEGWQVKRFTEKPDASTAQGMIESGNYLWNSGMFFWTIESFRSQLASAEPGALVALDEIASAIKRGDSEGAAHAFESVTSTSIDYALMEKASNVGVVRSNFDWDDLGSWDALSRSLDSDAAGNVSVGNARIVESSGCVAYNGSTKQRINLLGLTDVVVSITDDEVLVCSKDRAQSVRDLAD